MFTKSLLFMFCFIGLFTVLIAGIPSGFYAAQTLPDTDAGANPETIQTLSMNNLTVYNTAGEDEMTYPYSSLEDSPSPPNWLITGTTDDYVEVWWSVEPYVGPMLEIRHVQKNYFLGYGYWRLVDKLGVTYINGTAVSTNNVLITKAMLQAGWNSETNGSGFYAECPHTMTSVVFAIHNTTRDATISAAWDSGEIDYALSYERNWNATSLNAVNLLGQILTFRAPDFGIGGFAGLVVGELIRIPFTILAVVAAIKLIQSVLPWIKGIVD